MAQLVLNGSMPSFSRKILIFCRDMATSASIAQDHVKVAMKNSVFRLDVRRMALAPLMLGVALAASAPAVAQDGGVIRSFLGTIGVMPAETPDIDYRSRPPLVVPPANKLQDPTKPASERTAQWPNDPDVAARKATFKDSLIPATEREKYIQGQRPLLSQEELRRGKIDASAQRAPVRSAFDETPYETMTQPILTGRELALRRNAQNESQAALGTEPPRRYLSDPPPGLRKPVGSGAFSRTEDLPPEIRSRDGVREFTAEQNKR
jgi:hypothetical protein